MNEAKTTVAMSCKLLKGFFKGLNTEPIAEALRTVMARGYVVDSRGTYLDPATQRVSWAVVVDAPKSRPSGPTPVAVLNAAGFRRVTNHRWVYPLIAQE